MANPYTFDIIGGVFRGGLPVSPFDLTVEIADLEAKLASMQAELKEAEKAIEAIEALSTNCPYVNDSGLRCTDHHYKCGPCLIAYARTRAKDAIRAQVKEGES